MTDPTQLFSAKFAPTMTLFDAANALDPNLDEGQPKELLYAQRMSAMLARFAADASEAVALAVRAQHIQRWTVPRSNFPMTKEGYYQWRTGLYKFHAETAAGLMQQAGYGAEMVERVKALVAKVGLRVDAEAQLVEDVAALTFLEHYLAAFAEGKPDYDEAKWLAIIRKTWKKMSASAQEFALSGKLTLPANLLPLIKKALGEHS